MSQAKLYKDVAVFQIFSDEWVAWLEKKLDRQLEYATNQKNSGKMAVWTLSALPNTLKMSVNGYLVFI
jgi:hypothetical protein